MGFHSRQFPPSVSSMLAWAPFSRLPSICISHVVRWTDRPAMTIAVDLGRKANKQTNKQTCCSDWQLERSTCPKQRSFHSLKMRSRVSSTSFTSSSLDLTGTTSSGLILQICLIMSISLRCKRCKFVLVSGQDETGMEHSALHTSAVYMATSLVREVVGCENW